MKILFDAQIFQSYTAGGISRYHYELLKAVMNGGVHDVKIAGKFVKNIYIRDDAQLRKHFIYDPTASFSWLNKKLANKVVARADDYDLFHPSNPDYYNLNSIPADKKLVVTLHDMISEREDISIGQTKLEFARRADHVIAVSQTAKDDIVEVFGIPEEKISVIYHGSSMTPSDAKSVSGRQQPKLPVDFILFVGSRAKHKNFEVFLAGAAPVLRNNPELYLVCVTKKAFTKEEEELLRQYGIQEKVLRMAKVSDPVLAYLYCRAKLFVFPSLNEGFGIPILEAWACGTPMVLSDIPCFREVAAEGGSYFDPTSPESMAESIERALRDEDLRRTLVERGKKRLELFSWGKTVRQTTALYESIYHP